MSLLNQVLQDLDHRTPPGAEPPLRLAAAAQVLNTDNGAGPSAGPDWIRVGVWGVVGVAAMLAAWVLLDGDHAVREPRPISAKISFPAPVGVLVPAESDAIAATAPRAEPSRGEVEPARQLRLQVPPALPQLDVDSVPAHADVAAASDSVAEDRPGARPATPRADAQDAPMTTTRQVATSAEPDYIALRNAVAPAAPTSQPTAPRAMSAATVKTTTQPVLTPMQEAREAIAEGELALAEYLLQHRLRATPSDLEARELLIGLMLRGERYAAAMQQLEAGLERQPRHPKFFLIKARLLALSGDIAAATRWLESAPPLPAGRVEILQMLGALYQQQSRFEDAARTYRTLLRLTPSAGPAWVGLAISLDGLADPAAFEAFRRALALGGLPAAAEAYARERMQRREANDG